MKASWTADDWVEIMVVSKVEIMVEEMVVEMDDKWV